MSFPSSFGAQVAAILDVLAKAAVAEITKLAEDGSVVLRLEMRRRESEIQELRRSLKLTEAELCKAREAATGRTTVEQTAADKTVSQETRAAYLGPKAADSLCEPQSGTDESRSVRLAVKHEPVEEPVATEMASDGADVCAEAGGRNDPMWPPRSCGMLDKSSGAMQQRVQILTSQAEQFPAHCKSEDSLSSLPRAAAAEDAADHCLTVPIKVEVGDPPMRMEDTTSESVQNEQFRHVLHPVVSQDECLQSASQRSGPSLVISNVQTSAAGLLASNAQDHTHSRNGLRAKRLINVWRTNQKIYMCSVCNKGFPRLSQLEEHKAAHQPSKPFRCLECGKSFTQKTRLKTHQSVHTGERPFSCKICGKMFSRQDNCLRHERFHSGMKPHSCRQCGKSFTVLGNLRIHEESHLQGR